MTHTFDPFNQPIDLFRLILLAKSGHKPIASILTMPPDKLYEIELNCIAERSGYPMRVAFFCPNEGFEGNFGELSSQLESQGVEVLWLFGNNLGYLGSQQKNKWLIINDMARRISGIDAIITASVMDCLPDGPLHILHDHLSFAHFDLELHIDRLLHLPEPIRQEFSSMRELFNDISAFVAFIPFYDLILTPSNAVTKLTLNALRLTGYSDGVESSAAKENKLALDTISHLVDISRYREKISVFQSGYCKLDAPIKQYGNVPAEKIIVFAPTPNDASGNKESPLWTSALAVNLHGADLLLSLCINFPDYKIVFKPYKDELPEVVDNIRQKLAGRGNFVVDDCGSKYWNLYSRAKIMISDFSSTAYTFALGIGRPVVFFSPNEDTLSEEVKQNTYCRSRGEIGVVARTIDEVIASISNVIDDYDAFLFRVADFRKQNLVKPGGASAAAAEAVVKLILEQQSKKVIKDGVGIRMIRTKTEAQ